MQIRMGLFDISITNFNYLVGAIAFLGALFGVLFVLVVDPKRARLVMK